MYIECNKLKISFAFSPSSRTAVFVAYLSSTLMLLWESVKNVMCSSQLRGLIMRYETKDLGFFLLGT
jgi:hypothetical protein